MLDSGTTSLTESDGLLAAGRAEHFGLEVLGRSRLTVTLPSGESRPMGVVVRGPDVRGVG